MYQLSLRSGLVVLTLSFTLAATAENWPRWRGPEANGVALSGDYPVTWGPEASIRFRVPLPGGAGSTPVVWEDKIFVSSPQEGKNALLCINRGGEILWERQLGDERAGKHRKGSGSNPSPVTDGNLVFAYYKSGDLAALDFDGKVVWHLNLQEEFGEDTLWWDLGTSPVLTQDNVIVAVMQEGPSYVVALDKATGDVAWKEDRTFKVPEEADQSYTTPMIVSDGGKETIVIAGADHVTGHDAKTGKTVWTVGNLNPEQQGYFRSIASPVVAGETLVVPYARGDTLTGIKLGGSGDVTKSHTLWTVRHGSSDVPTPAYVDGKIYSCGDRGEAFCINPENGDILWQESLPKSRTNYSSSPIVAGKHLYVTREDGTTFVLDVSGSQPSIVSENSLGEKTLATPVFVDGTILIRTFDNLYCIGN